VAVGLVQQMIAEHLGRGGIAVMTSHQEVALASVTTYTIELGG
jgi:ABC-type transport system involved in cytochrome c biogenesis ATPase subunit